MRRLSKIFIKFALLVMVFHEFEMTSVLQKNGRAEKICGYDYSAGKCEPNLPLCAIKRNFIGEIKPDLKPERLEVVEERLSHLVSPGGFYAPRTCKARNRVCIITAFRDREAHLPLFLKNLHSFLMKQKMEYKIIVVEQTPGRLFNRGTLYNVGYVEAMRMQQWDNIVFHDVDLYPLDDRNLYICSKKNPRHLSAVVNGSTMYKTNFGGVSSTTPEQFEKMNGFSNLFWGWGGEDDDFWNRAVHAGYTVERYSNDIAKYVEMAHMPSYRNPDRHQILSDGKNHFEDSGLNSLKYHVKKFEKKRTYTWILVDLIPEELS